MHFHKDSYAKKQDMPQHVLAKGALTSESFFHQINF